MEIKQIIGNVTEFFNEFVAPVHKITSVEASDDSGWKLTVEVIEEKEYMKKYAKDEMLGIYDVHLNSEQEVTSYKRQDIRYRSSIKMEV
ncbi:MULTISPECIES: gas vesicle protein GvpO [Bacillaceae]|uniref:gas vesicle protein GvpO n=1 Tax=Bacillaceae TaxID=186817 RepID=UPI0006ADF593|nr:MULTISPECIES: gas vesicle protein GvpO [Bacillaceae]ALC86926.1 gas vesicle protein GvpR [Bacillus sp. FJAT-22090]KQL37398.1 gas vesicle protein GvpR [Psychrobacillus sp. FJAT-21963]MDF2068658.1 gas vesicle protein [Bacillus sp. Cr_A10]